jgi:adenine-specific DNA-methyltransferase
VVAGRAGGSERKQVEDYRHDEAQRLNVPEAGLARYDVDAPPTATLPLRVTTDRPHDPRVDPQLLWHGKAERANVEVDAVSLHVHERLSTEAILRTLRKEEPQLSLFGDPQLDRGKEVQFYQHDVDWTNRLVLGDSLVVMTSLLERERMAGQVQCIYFDPPYGINYNSNFQRNISNNAPRENEQALTREPEQIQAYRDTWQYGVHSYLTYLRDRLLLCRELLADTGCVYVQIGSDRMHLVKTLLDEIFLAENALPTITVQKTSQVTSSLLPEVSDFLLWYAVDRERFEPKYRQLYEDRGLEMVADGDYRFVELASGERRQMSHAERSDPSLLPEGARIFRYGDATSQGFSKEKSQPLAVGGVRYPCPQNRHWLLRPEGMTELVRVGRIEVVGKTPLYVRYLDEGGLVRRTNIWTDVGQAGSRGRKKAYVVETNPKVVERAILMATDPGDLVLDPTCGSGTTAYVAEKHGRRWITCDTSRVALALARERILTATYPYYKLRDERRGVDGGIRYATRPWVKASSIGYGDREFDNQTLYDQPEEDKGKVRVSGPYTVEALSSYAINPAQENVPRGPGGDTASADHVNALLDALRVHGIPLPGGRRGAFASLTRLAGTGELHGEGVLADGRSCAVSVGPRYGPITRRQVDEALDDAYGYALVVFAGFNAQAEVQTFLGKGRVGRFDVVLLEANADLLVGDLLRNTKGSQTFRLFAAPDVRALREGDGVFVELRGVDFFDASTGESSAKSKGEIAAWFLDQNFDGEVFHVTQAFFPQTKAWDRLAAALRGTLDEDLLRGLAEFQSAVFIPGEHRRAAVRVVDDTGQTSEAILDLGEADRG